MKAIITAFAVLALVPVFVHADIGEGLVGYWPLDEVSSVRYDATSTNDLTDNNTVLYGTGVNGNAADFENAATEYLSITDAVQVNLDFSTAFSWSGWVRPESSGTGLNDQPLVSKFGSPQMGWFFGISGTVGRVGISSNGSSYTHRYFPYDYPTYTWSYLSLTYNAGTVKIYINGALSSTSTAFPSTIFNNNIPFMLGWEINHPASFDGLLDEVGVWSRALTAEEVQALYNEGEGWFFPFAPTTTAATTTAATTTAATDVLNYQEELFLVSVIIFFISLGSWGRIAMKV